MIIFFLIVVVFLIIGIFSPKLALFWIKTKESRTRAVSFFLYFGLLLVSMGLISYEDAINKGETDSDHIITGIFLSLPFLILAFIFYLKSSKKLYSIKAELSKKTQIKTNTLKDIMEQATHIRNVNISPEVKHISDSFALLDRNISREGFRAFSQYDFYVRALGKDNYFLPLNKKEKFNASWLYLYDIRNYINKVAVLNSSELVTSFKDVFDQILKQPNVRNAVNLSMNYYYMFSFMGVRYSDKHPLYSFGVEYLKLLSFLVSKNDLAINDIDLFNVSFIIDKGSLTIERPYIKEESCIFHNTRVIRKEKIQELQLTPIQNMFEEGFSFNDIDHNWLKRGLYCLFSFHVDNIQGLSYKFELFNSTKDELLKEFSADDIKSFILFKEGTLKIQLEDEDIYLHDDHCPFIARILYLCKNNFKLNKSQ